MNLPPLAGDFALKEDGKRKVVDLIRTHDQCFQNQLYCHQR